jgi:hypothetical protein
MVHQYLDSKPNPEVTDFLKYDLDELTAKYAGVVGTTFRAFPSYPQRYSEVLDPQPLPPEGLSCRVEPLKLPRVKTFFTEDDLAMRQFLPHSSHQVIRKGKHCAA